MTTTKALYNYLKENAEQITEEWMNNRSIQPGSFYSIEAPQEVDRVLRKQHQQTIQLMISYFDQNEENCQKKLEEWAQIVAKSRVENRIAIHEVINFLRKTRKLFWQYVKHYIHQSDDSVCKKSVAEWSDTINSAFDEMIVKFSEYYHEFNEKRLSEQKDLIKLLEIPLIKICDKVSVLPVIGVINSDRGLSLLNEIPLKCNEVNVESLILDLSGVSQIEEAVAFQLTQLVQVLNLMGIKSYISGIRPEVARKAMSFGDEFHRIQKISSIQEVIGGNVN
ncbi:MAG: STAS domain-containing protein [Paenisporosarcina sp.]